MKKSPLLIIIVLAGFLALTGGKAAAQGISRNKWDLMTGSFKPPFLQRLYITTEVNMGYGARWLDQPYEIRRMGISAVAGYRFSRAFAGGIGGGIERYNGGTLLPVFLEGIVYLTKWDLGVIKPFLSGSTGILIRQEGFPCKTRVYANPAFGFGIPITTHSTLQLSLGLHTQWQLKIQRDSFLNAKVGLLFN